MSLQIYPDTQKYYLLCLDEPPRDVPECRFWVRPGLWKHALEINKFALHFINYGQTLCYQQYWCIKTTLAPKWTKIIFAGLVYIPCRKKNKQKNKQNETKMLFLWQICVLNAAIDHMQLRHSSKTRAFNCISCSINESYKVER